MFHSFSFQNYKFVIEEKSMKVKKQTGLEALDWYKVNDP